MIKVILVKTKCNYLLKISTLPKEELQSGAKDIFRTKKNKPQCLKLSAIAFIVKGENFSFEIY
tara:strand:- start:110062 stop:110250 length:189 start_codon:yes stop_codon:yes gene_type:complete